MMVGARPRQLVGIGGDLDAGALERAAARRGDVVADDAPAGGAEMLREGAAHDAETDDTDGAALPYGHALTPRLCAGHIPFMFIATDEKFLASRLATISLVVAAYFLK